MVKRFLHSGRNGFYLAVLSEGKVEAGDGIEVIARDADRVTVADIVELYTGVIDDRELLQRATRLAALPESWRAYFRKRLGKVDAWHREP
jgi:MOSC domain-containing protein YiiM